MSIEDAIRRIVREELRTALAEIAAPASRAPVSPSEELWGAARAAEYLGVSVNRIYDWRVNRKGPPARQVGRLLRFRQADLDAWTAAQQG